MIVRERYMRLIRDFMDKPVIKIITGMRRSGKSALLELTRQELLDRGVDRKNIIFINFESLRYEALRDYKALYAEIIKIAGQTEGRIYVLLDEIQEVNAWEQVIGKQEDQCDAAVDLHAEYLCGVCVACDCTDVETKLSFVDEINKNDQNNCGDCKADKVEDADVSAAHVYRGHGKSEGIGSVLT